MYVEKTAKTVMPLEIEQFLEKGQLNLTRLKRNNLCEKVSFSIQQPITSQSALLTFN